MQTPLKKIIVYDLETGGFNCDFNSITEIAMVVIDLETLDIIEEMSVIFKPRLDLSIFDENPTKEAKSIFNDVAVKDDVSGVKTLTYKGQSITPKTSISLSGDIEKFREYLITRKSSILTNEDIEQLQETEYKDIVNLYVNRCYNAQALEVTHMSLELMQREGLEYLDAFTKIQDLIKRHTVGNNKPILAGHNIKSFDNPFMEKLFRDNKSDFYKGINTFMIDTLEWVRLRWIEMPSFSLGVCANELGLTLKEAHRALPDTVANAKLLIKMLKTFRGEGTKENVYIRPKFDFNF